MRYRIRCTLWQIEATSSAEAKKLACEMLRKQPELFITAEQFAPKHGLLHRLVWGS